MDRQQVLDKAFEVVYFPKEVFDLSMLYGLGNSVSASVEPLLGHALHRINAWLWPVLSTFLPGDTVRFGDMTIEMRDDVPAEGREHSKKSFIATVENRQWRFGWANSEGATPYLIVAADIESFFSDGYCEFRRGLEGPARGCISGKGSDVRSMFEFIGHCSRLMPEQYLRVREKTVENSWEFDELSVHLDYEGGLGASMSADLYEMAEQKACRIIAEWAAPRAQFLTDFLIENDFEWGDGYISHSYGANQVFAIEAGDHRGAYYHNTFPGTDDGDRYLTWFDRAADGRLATLNIYEISAGDDGIELVKSFHEGDIPNPSVSHDFATGRTVFSNGVQGYDHLANSTLFLSDDSRMAANFDPENEGTDFERRTCFEDLFPEAEVKVSPAP